MFCPNCSYKNTIEAKFCAKCGGSLQLANPSPKNPQGIIINGENPTVSEGMKWGILIATIIIPIIGIVLGIIYMQDISPEKKSAGKLWLYGGLIMAVIYTLSIANNR